MNAEVPSIKTRIEIQRDFVKCCGLSVSLGFFLIFLKSVLLLKETLRYRISDDHYLFSNNSLL